MCLHLLHCSYSFRPLIVGQFLEVATPGHSRIDSRRQSYVTRRPSLGQSLLGQAPSGAVIQLHATVAWQEDKSVIYSCCWSRQLSHSCVRVSHQALCYKSEGRGLESRWGEWISFNLPNPSGRTRPWGLLSSKTKEYQKQKYVFGK
jgi:hypothetical protein